MKTTIEIPDELHREVKALAALTGRTVKELVHDALRRQIEEERGRKGPRGWRVAFGKVLPADVARVQAVVDEELSQIEAEAWR